MNSDRHERVQALLGLALECAETQRAAFFAESCGGDDELREELESLVRVSADSEAFFVDLERRLGATPPGAGAGLADDSASVMAALNAAIGMHYRVDSVLARGGMGIVFEASDRKHGRRVAVKTILPEFSDGMGERFLREIRITAGLQHPNILPLLDSGDAAGILFFIMPYVDGETLKDRLERIGRLAPATAVQIGVGIADGLAHAHGRGVLHRDIKPSNILLAEGHVQIVDFGIARAVAPLGSTDRTATGIQVGTPTYMAPEQFGGESTQQSDIFALGAVLYEALTGRAWRAVTEADSTWALVPDGLTPILTRALARDPAHRWASALDLARALRSWDRPIALRGPGESAGSRGVFRRIADRMMGRPQDGFDVRSVAVLPFGNLNRDSETEYFSDGITEDITTHLSRIHGIKVISRTSAMRYKDSPSSITRIGRDLGVATILEGSVRRQGDRVRIVSQLIDARTDSPLWTATYDRQLTDIFEIQSEIAQRIAQALRVRITDHERSLIVHRPTDDVEAHDLYLRGRYLWNRRTRAGLEGAEEQFQQAATRDPLFAPAYAGLADAHLLLGGYGYRPEIESLHRARVASERALQLDDRLAEAHASQGQVLRADRNWSGEERAYRRAIELNPNYATAHQWYATLLTALGRADEARGEIERAVELDPLSHAIGVTSGIVRFMTRDYDGALAEFDRTLQLEPRFFSAYAWLLLLWGHLGEFEKGFKAWESLRELHSDPRLAHFAGAYLYARAGRGDEALAILQERKGGEPDHGWTGLIHAQLGNTEEAFTRLEATLDDPSWRLFVLQRNLLFYVNVGPWFDGIRDHPRFRGLLARMQMEAGPARVRGRPLGFRQGMGVRFPPG